MTSSSISGMAPDIPNKYLKIAVSGLFPIFSLSEMRREIKNPKVIPLAKYVFEYYEEAAEHGEELKDCKEIYHRCPYSLDYFYKRTKAKKSQVERFSDPYFSNRRSNV